MAETVRALRPVARARGLGVHAWRRHRFAALLALLVTVPSLFAVLASARAGWDGRAWVSLVTDSQWPEALALSLGSGVAAAALSMVATAWLLSRAVGTRAWMTTVRGLGPMLAMPHAAFAIGVAMLVAPSGWILRIVSPWATGLLLPPDWATVHDPVGAGLVTALVAKEVPFLLWTAASQLQRLDCGPRWLQELELAQTMGYGRRAAWWRIVWPQLWPRLTAPWLAVLAYSMTVVDVALVIGPASPPTAAVLAWQWLLDPDAAVNAKGAAGAWCLAFAVVAVLATAWLMVRRPHWRWRWTSGSRGRRDLTAWRTWLPLVLLVTIYGCVLATLALGSVFGIWRFPALIPQAWTTEAWTSVASSKDTIVTTLGLAGASSATATAWCLAWLELAPRAWDARLRRVVYLPLLLPSVLWVLGVHGLAVAWRIDGEWLGLWIAHAMASLPYVLIALTPAYLSFDDRYAQLAASLGCHPVRFLIGVKWPMLRAGIAGALAVGFAVSVAQYLPTLFVGAGRFDTVTTEAVTLASGGERSVLAAYAWLQWLLPAVAFSAAAWFGRPRRFWKRKTT